MQTTSIRDLIAQADLPFTPFSLQFVCMGKPYKVTFECRHEFNTWAYPKSGEHLRRIACLKIRHQVPVPAFGSVISPGRLSLESWMLQHGIDLFSSLPGWREGKASAYVRPA